MVCLYRAAATGVQGVVSAKRVCDVSGGGNVILIAFLLALLAIAADGGLEDEAFQDEPPCITDEME